MSNVMEKIVRFFGGRADCEQKARECGLVVRESKFGGVEFLLVFTHGICGVPEATLDQLAQFLKAVCDVRMAPQSLDGRLNEAAVTFMRAMLVKALSIAAEMEGGREAFGGRFNHVYIIDSTNFPLHPSLRIAFKGSGGDAAPAMMRIQFVMDFVSGVMCIKVGDARLCDAPTLRKIVDADSLPSDGETLWMGDLGYASLATSAAIDDKGGYSLFRVRHGTKFKSPDGSQVNLTGILKERPTTFDIPVAIDGQSFRLVGRRLPEEHANRAIQKSREKRRQDGRPGDIGDECKLFSNYLLFLTNLPVDEFPIGRLMVIYKVRWQIELVFKTWKSLLRINVIKTARQHRLECEVYGKLIMAVMITALAKEAFRLYEPKPSCRVACLSLHKAINRAKVFIAVTWTKTAFACMPWQRNAVTQFMRDIRDNAIKSYCAKRPSIEMMLANPDLLFESGKYMRIIS